MSERSRYHRGWVVAATCRIRRVTPITTAQLWKVESETDKDVEYSVVQKADGEIFCDCPDFGFRGETCKHIYGVVIYESGIQNYAPELKP